MTALMAHSVEDDDSDGVAYAMGEFAMLLLLSQTVLYVTPKHETLTYEKHDTLSQTRQRNSTCANLSVHAISVQSLQWLSNTFLCFYYRHNSAFSNLC